MKFNKKLGARNLVKGYKKILERKINLLISSEHFEKLNGLKGKIRLNIFIKNGEIFANFNYKNSGEIKYEIVDYFKENNSFIKVLEGKMIDLDEIAGVFGKSNIGEVKTYFNNNLLYVVNSGKFNGKMKYLKNIIESGTDLNGENLSRIGLKASNVEKLIEKIIKKEGVNYKDIEELILVRLYGAFEPLCLVHGLNMDSLIEELIPIILRTLSKKGIK